MFNSFMGVYVLPDREIHIDENTSNEDLRLVIRKLVDEIDYMTRERLRSRDFYGNVIEPKGL